MKTQTKDKIKYCVLLLFIMGPLSAINYLYARPLFPKRKKEKKRWGARDPKSLNQLTFILCALNAACLLFYEPPQLYFINLT